VVVVAWVVVAWGFHDLNDGKAEQTNQNAWPGQACKKCDCGSRSACGKWQKKGFSQVQAGQAECVRTVRISPARAMGVQFIELWLFPAGESRMGQ